MIWRFAGLLCTAFAVYVVVTTVCEGQGSCCCRK
jgi:hypothetical protein